MSRDRITKPDCPVGECRCSVIDDLLGLKQLNQELEENVQRDGLTRLFNYHHFVIAMEGEMERTQRSGQPTSLLLLDLDHFKRVNDTYGHECGNQVLRMSAQQIVRTVRKIDIPCRYGGEEFAIILPNTQMLMAVRAAQRVREALEKMEMEIDGAKIRITASLGVSTYQTGQKESVESLVKQADHYLYQAKQEGRNRVAHPEADYLKPDGTVTPEERQALTE